MSGFSPAWLLLREPADRAARSMELAGRLAAGLVRPGGIRVVDLACGTGANLRALAGLLPGRQEWMLVDHDPGLIDRVIPLVDSWVANQGQQLEERIRTRVSFTLEGGRACRVELRLADLSRLDDPSLFDGRHLVTASALLDLVSESWLDALVRQCQAVGAVVFFPLNYDGRVTCSPAEPDDDFVCRLVNCHQHTDKGFGPALGPDGPSYLLNALTTHGYAVHFGASDWHLDEGTAVLQRRLVDGWMHAAVQGAPEHANRIRSWHAARQAHIDRGRSCIRVGHQDVLAWPPGPVR